MESVYFGKENTEALLHPDENKSGNNGNRNENLKEYYFPDESRNGFKILRLICALLLTSFVDFLVIGVGFDIYFAEAAYDHPYMNHIDVMDFVLLWGIMLVYAFFCLLITPLFYNAGREKTYVRYGNTFYILKTSVRVKTNKMCFLLPKEFAEKRIHYSYSKQIAKLDRMIEKGRKVKKVLTDCKISDDIGAKEGTYEGYNEKKMRDEEFRIPAGYAKYDPEKKYYKPSVLPIFFFIIIKAAMYISVFMIFVNNGKANYSVYQNNLDPYIERKSVILAPFDYVYAGDNEYRSDHNVEFKYEEDPYKEVRFYTGLNDSGMICDHSISIDLHMYYDEDLASVYNLVRAVANIDIEGTDLEKDIEDFKDGDKDEIVRQEYVSGNYVSYTIRQSYCEDYHLNIFIVY